MADVTIYDAFADSFMQEFRLYLLALSGRYQQLRLPGILVTPYAVTTLRRDGQTLARTFYGIAESRIDDYLKLSREDASPELLGLLNERRGLALHRIRSIIDQVAAQIVTQAKVADTPLSALFKNATGAIGQLVQREVGKIAFKANDTAGRKWDAEKLMRTVVREFAYQAFIDHQIDTFANIGYRLVQTSTGEILSIDHGPRKYRDFFEVRHQVFHPNSKTTMEPYVPA